MIEASGPTVPVIEADAAPMMAVTSMTSRVRATVEYSHNVPPVRSQTTVTSSRRPALKSSVDGAPPAERAGPNTSGVGEGSDGAHDGDDAGRGGRKSERSGDVEGDGLACD